MEYLHGEDCRTLLRELNQRDVPLPMEHALAIAVGACTGCHFAHEQADDEGRPLGLIHRDVSPSNVVVTYAGAVKLVDFGIAKATNLEDITAVGVTKGKLAYMAPEQCRGEPLDRRVDIYALGVLLYELTTQRRAFAGQNDAQVMWSVISGEVPPPRTHVPDFPEALAAIIKRAMDVDRTRRYATAREMSLALETFARDAGLTLNPTALGEFLERTMGPKQEPWRVSERARTPAPVSPLAATLPVGADAPTYAPMGTPVSARRAPTATGTDTHPSTPTGETALGREAETVAEMAVTTPRVRTSSNPQAAAPRARSPWLVIGVATVVAGGLVAATMVWRSQQRRESPRDPVVLLAERGTARLEGTDGGPAALADADAAAPPAADAAAAPDAGVASRPLDAGVSRPRPPTGDPLSRAFARRQALVARCFTQHAATVVSQPSLTLRFEVDAEGKPTRVDVTPAELASTPLGACIADVGRGTRFPRQGAPAVFRIPVSVRASGGTGGSR
jgi:hypothetical protein